MRWQRPTALKQYRVIKRFAWFPVTIGQEKRWLERVYILQNSFETQYFSYMYSSRKREYTHSEFSWKNNKFTVKPVYEDYIKNLYETACKETLL